MKKTGNQILEQIKLELEELKGKAVELERRISEIDLTEADETEDKPFDIILDEISFVIPKRKEELGIPLPDLEPLVEPEPAVEATPIVEAEPVVEAVPAVEPEPAVEATPIVEAEPVVKAVPAVEPEPETIASDKAVEPAQEVVSDEPVFEPEPIELPDETIPTIEPAKEEPKEVEEKPQVKRRWHLDTPGSELSNILSAMALKERGAFINGLFKEDAQLFIDTIAAMNAMTSLDQAEEYINKHFPNWKLDSDIVYKFMMAVRRKLR